MQVATFIATILKKMKKWVGGGGGGGGGGQLPSSISLHLLCLG